MRDKKNITITLKNSLRLIFVFVLTIVLVVTLISGILKKSKSRTLSRYYQSFDYILEGFSQAINYYIKDYETDIYNIIDEKRLSSYTIDETAEYLKEQSINFDFDYFNLFYIYPDCTIVFSDHHVDSYADVISFADIEAQTNEYYVTDLIGARGSDNYLFNIICPVRNKNGKVTGALGASLKIENLKKVIKNIKLGDIGTLSLSDCNGNFIVHKDEDMLGKNYTPPSTKYEHLTSKFLAQQPEGHILSEANDGSLIDLFYHRIENTGWVLTLTAKHSNITEISDDYSRSTAILIVVIILLIIMFILIGAMAIYQYKAERLLVVDIDPLTNLMTRSRFETEVEKIIKKSPKTKYMLVDCDIRGLKFINQNYGGQEADNIIVYFAGLLTDFMKEREGVVARGFADHFYMFYKVSAIHRGVAEFKNDYEKLYETIKGYDIPFFPKFGISFMVPHDDGSVKTVQELLGQASFAKSTIKDDILSNYALYNSTLLEKVNREHFIEDNMDAALENGEFFVLYQPKIELLTEKVVGAEALVRWNSPKLGILNPDTFIPLFEKNGFIKKLDFYVYQKVFKFISRLMEEKKPLVPISVNMSRNHNKPEKFIHDFMSLFSQYHIPPELVEIEILERSFMNGDTLKTFAQLLHENGFTVAMDDFGSGESSLNMLNQVPVDVLKFDRTFLVSSTTEDGKINSDSANFIETLVELSRNLKKQTIFEGVETKDQIDFLKGIECDQVQGFYFSKPLTEFDFIQYLEDHS